MFSCSVISTLRDHEEAAADRSYCTLLDCLCSWGHVGHILELVCDWLPEEPPQASSLPPDLMPEHSLQLLVPPTGDHRQIFLEGFQNYHSCFQSI